MPNAVICDAVRTPIGRFQGALAGTRPDDLAALVLRTLAERHLPDAAVIDEVLLGATNQAGEDNRNVARMALLLAGFPDSVPGVTVNRLCASGLEAVVQAHRAIATGDAEVVLAGGVEVMSRAPYSLPRGGQHPKAGNLTMWDTTLGWRYPNPALAARFPLEAMGETAENLAEREGISRQDQDAFALRSHARAVAAMERGAFAREIVAAPIGTGRGASSLTSDEGPRADTSLEKLAALAPAFRTPGTVTAGNSSPLNDGASALLLASEGAAARLALPVRAEIVATASAGVDPRVMGFGPVPAVRKALAKAGLTAADVDRWEINEAFAAQALACVRALGLDLDRVNVRGGAIALGHPLGASGARILTTLLHGLEDDGGSVGVATLCVGVGQGLAMVIRRR
jgi:3-oxoadipyl-CoA thiolase